ncbi:MAG: HesB/IscA family protein [Acidiferrobacterales bacterium]
MITVTNRAARQIRASNDESPEERLLLRLAAKISNDGSFEYGLGMDEEREGDQLIESEGAQILVARESQDLLKDCVLDYVELEEGKPQFIFMNPNDPSYIPPTDIDLADIPVKYSDN